MKNDPATLCSALLKGDTRALARVLSLIEERDSRAATCLELLFPHTGNCFVVGITGSPGAGKSTLVDQLASSWASAGKRVGILAVDPSSPFTGGALLGDRIRMAQSSLRSEVYIRSMATRGALGGLAPQTAEAILALDAARFDVVIIETVGVGQSEVEIARTADCVCVVLVPGMGDNVQALKAGILEIADVFVLNKADYAGVEQLEKELTGVLALSPKELRKPRIVRTVASSNSGIDTLSGAIDEFKQWAIESGIRPKRQERFLERLLIRLILSDLEGEVAEFMEKSAAYQTSLRSLKERKVSPARIARELLEAYRAKREKGAVGRLPPTGRKT